MTTAPATIRHRADRVQKTKLEFRAATPAEAATGFCGFFTGVALPYNVVDSYGTVFVPGCLDKTRAKVAAKKVKIFLDHMYGVPMHVGTVLELPDVEGAALIRAGIFDTVQGREAKEYLAAVLASGSETGLSIGFYTRSETPGQVDGQTVTLLTEVELEEFSLTPRPAVPGSTVTGVRKEGEGMDPAALAVAERCFRTLLETLPADRSAAIVAEVTAARGGAAPPPTATAATPADEAAHAANASGEDTRTDDSLPRADASGNVPLEERVAFLKRSLSPS